VLSRPFDSLPLLQQVTKPIPLHFPQGNRTAQLHLALAHRDHLPISSPGTGFYGDFLTCFKRIGCKHHNVMLRHLAYHRWVGSTVAHARKCCCIPHTWEGNLPRRNIQPDLHRHYSDKPPAALCFQRLCVLLPSVEPHSSGFVLTPRPGPVSCEPAARAHPCLTPLFRDRPRTPKRPKHLFARSTHRTFPLVGQFSELHPFGDLPLAVTSVGIIKASAVHHLTLIHFFRIRHGIFSSTPRGLFKEAPYLTLLHQDLTVQHAFPRFPFLITPVLYQETCHTPETEGMLYYQHPRAPVDHPRKTSSMGIFMTMHHLGSTVVAQRIGIRTVSVYRGECLIFHLKTEVYHETRFRVFFPWQGCGDS
jgi:hypothetical protein